MSTNKKMLIVFLAVVLIAAVVTPLVFMAKRMIFRLDEVPVPAESILQGGQYVKCTAEPSPDVMKYPALSTESALYGKAGFDEDKKAGRAGVSFQFAVEESKGKGKGYDRLYFDLNRNLDLSDDPVLTVVESRPTQRNAERFYTVTFGNITIPWDFGPGTGTKDITLVPTFHFDKEKRTGSMYFLLATERKGKLRLPDGLYDVTLRQAYAVTGRYDRPRTTVMLNRPDRSFRLFGEPIIRRPPVELQGSLSDMWSFRRAWYTLKASPAGDSLSLERYTGGLGGLDVSVGKGNVAASGISVWLASESTRFAVSDEDMSDSAHAAGGSLRAIPVGDYAPEGINLKLGQCHVSLQRNYISDGVLRDWDNHPPRYWLKVRDNEVASLAVPAAANIVFASPVDKARFKPGDTVEIRTAVVEPTLDLILGNAQDLGGGTTKGRKGGWYYPFPKRVLHVSGSSGNVLFEGDIDEPDADWYRSTSVYEWQIPADLKLPSGEETLTLTVTVDTWDVFGVVTGSRAIVVEKPEGE